MSRRVVIGKRGDEYGMWVSKPGFDAFFAGVGDLLLGMEEATEQMIMIGAVFSTPSVVPLGLTQIPYVFLTSSQLVVANNPSSNGETTGSAFTISGTLFRPWPYHPKGPSANCHVNVSQSQMTIDGGSDVVHYTVFRRAP